MPPVREGVALDDAAARRVGCCCPAAGPASLTAIADDHVVNARVKRRTPHQQPGGEAHDQERDVAERPSRPTATSPWSPPGTARPRATAATASATGSQPVGQAADREERAREQEQREQPDAHDRPRTAASLSCVTAYAVQRRPRTPTRRAPRPGSRARPTHDGTPPRIAATTRKTVADMHRADAGPRARARRTRRPRSTGVDDRGVVRAQPLHARRSPATATRPPPASSRSPP